MPAALLSRFDLIFILLDTPDKERDLQLAKHIGKVHQDKSKVNTEFFDEKFLRNYIAMSKAFEPVIARNAAQLIAQGDDLPAAHSPIGPMVVIAETSHYARAFLLRKLVQRLESWAITPLHVFVERWPSLPIYLKATYPREQLDSNFYKGRFNQLIGSLSFEEISEESREAIELLIKDLLARWDALLHAKMLEHQLTELEEEQELFSCILENISANMVQ